MNRGTPSDCRDEVTVVLQRHYGATAVFRPQQLEAICTLVAGSARLLVVQATG